MPRTPGMSVGDPLGAEDHSLRTTDVYNLQYWEIKIVKLGWWNHFAKNMCEF